MKYFTSFPCQSVYGYGFELDCATIERLESERREWGSMLFTHKTKEGVYVTHVPPPNIDAFRQNFTVWLMEYRNQHYCEAIVNTLIDFHFDGPVAPELQDAFALYLSESPKRYRRWILLRRLYWNA